MPANMTSVIGFTIVSRNVGGRERVAARGSTEASSGAAACLSSIEAPSPTRSSAQPIRIPCSRAASSGRMIAPIENAASA